MRARHTENPQHKALYQSINKEITESLEMDDQKANRYFLFKGLFYGLIAIFSYFSMYFIDNPWLFTFDFILFGFTAVLLCFNFAHDFSHHAIFKKPFWDNLLFEFIYTLVGAHPEAWKKRHTGSHHFAPNVENYDTDLAITGLIRVLPNSQLKWYHQYQHLYATLAYMSYSFYWVFIKDFLVVKQYAPASEKKKIRYYLTFAGLKSFYILYLLILPAIFSKQPLLVAIMAFILMHMVQSVYTLFTFFITHHVHEANYPTASKEGLINTSWLMNQIKSSNDFYPLSKAANFLFGGVNNHIAHHLFPHISHYYYPTVNVILYHRLKEFGIHPNVSTYFGGLISHLHHLKLMGKKKL